MFKKILIVGLTLITGIGLFAGCDSEFTTHSVSVSIKTEYKERFLAREFSIDDFNWENIERIEYGTWHPTNDPEIGFLTIYLKRHGKRQVNDAVKHFITLDFVGIAERVGIIKLP